MLDVLFKKHLHLTSCSGRACLVADLTDSPRVFFWSGLANSTRNIVITSYIMENHSKQAVMKWPLHLIGLKSCFEHMAGDSCTLSASSSKGLYHGSSTRAGSWIKEVEIKKSVPCQYAVEQETNKTSADSSTISKSHGLCWLEGSSCDWAANMSESAEGPLLSHKEQGPLYNLLDIIFY